jgi:hypothetical protein
MKKGMPKCLAEISPARDACPRARPEGGMRGARTIARRLFRSDHSSAPRGDIEASTTAYPRCARTRNRRPGLCARGVWSKTPEAGSRYSCRGRRPGHAAQPALVPRLPQAPHPAPRERTVRNTRSLMEQGWLKSNRGGSGGDKFRSRAQVAAFLRPAKRASRRRVAHQKRCIPPPCGEVRRATRVGVGVSRSRIALHPTIALAALK